MARVMPARNWSGRAAGLEEGAVDQLNINPPVLHRLDRIGDLHQLARCGVGISEVARARRISLAALRWGTWIRLSSSRWLSNDSPQAQRMMLVGRCDGNRSPASTWHVSAPSSRAAHAIPESRPQSGAIETRAKRPQRPSAPGRRWRPCRTCIPLDGCPERSHSSRPTDRGQLDCRSGSQSFRRARHRNRRASIPRGRLLTGGG
jgi:hypothetical protein